MTTLVVVVTALGAIFAGCGGGDSGASADGTGSGESAAKAEFVKQATAACAKARQGSFERIATFEGKHDSEGLPKAVLDRMAIRAVLLSTIKAEIDGLRALEAPAGEEQEVAAMIASSQASLNKAKQGMKVPKKGLTDAQKVDYWFTASDKQLRDYGLDGCTKT